MDQQLVNLLLALITHELLHNLVEVASIRSKIKRLATYIAGKPYKEMTLNIDTRLKSYTISFVMFFVFVLPLWGLFTWLELSGDTALWYGVIVLTLTYALTVVFLDRVHVEIERVTRPFMKKSK